MSDLVCIDISLLKSEDRSQLFSLYLDFIEFVSLVWFLNVPLVCCVFCLCVIH